MRWRDIGGLTCSVARALSVVGDRWTLLILRDAFLGVRRFDDFQADLGTTRHRLADRLRTLVAHGIFDRVPYQERPARFEYRLTEKGRDLYPIVVSMTRWGDRWMAGADGPPIELVHRSCGRSITPALTCPVCSEPIDPRHMEARPGPTSRQSWQRPKEAPRAGSARQAAALQRRPAAVTGRGTAGPTDRRTLGAKGRRTAGPTGRRKGRGGSTP